MKKSMTVLLAAAVAMFAGCGQEETAERQPEVIVEKTAEELKDDTISEAIEHMTVEEKVGQMIMMDFRKNPDDSGMTVLSEDCGLPFGRGHFVCGKSGYGRADQTAGSGYAESGGHAFAHWH